MISWKLNEKQSSCGFNSPSYSAYGMWMVQELNTCPSSYNFIKYFTNIHNVKLASPNISKSQLHTPHGLIFSLIRRKLTFTQSMHKQMEPNPHSIMHGTRLVPKQPLAKLNAQTQDTASYTYPKYTTNLSVSTLSTQRILRCEHYWELRLTGQTQSSQLFRFVFLPRAETCTLWQLYTLGPLLLTNARQEVRQL